jgi:PAS domain S-box-containing protein
VEQSEAIFNSINDGIVQLDMKGRILKINKRITEFGGWKEKEIVGKNIRHLSMFPPKDLRKMYSYFIKTISGQRAPLQEVEVFTKSGERKTVEIHGSLLKKNEKSVGVVTVIRDITDRKRAEEQIKKALKEKEILVREIHHRVKNNMQLMLSLLRLQSRKLKNEEAVEILDEWRNRIRTIALIHEKLYRSEDVAIVNFRDFVQALVFSLFHTFEIKDSDIRLNVKIENVFLDLNTAIPLGLIVNEIISNAIKHAFPGKRKGQICLVMHSENKNQNILIISDNGVGIQGDTNFKSPQTLGFQLVKDLIEQIRGRIEFVGRDGTTFKIIFTA